MKSLSKGGDRTLFCHGAPGASLKPLGSARTQDGDTVCRAAFQRLLILAHCPEIFTEYFMGHEVARNKQAYIIKGMGKEEFRKQYHSFEAALTLVQKI